MTQSYKHALELLEKMIDIFHSKSLYILGAGVSALHIFPKYDLYRSWKDPLYEIIKDDVLNIDDDLSKTSKEEMYNEEHKSRSMILGVPLSRKELVHHPNDIQAYIEDKCDEIVHEKIRKNPEIMRLICAATYSLSQYPIYCPEYYIFNLIQNNSVVATLNHDNLASKFIKRKNIISLHGNVTPALKKLIMELIPLAVRYDLTNILPRNHYFAARETEIIRSHDAYKAFQKELYNGGFNYIVIIGYSFFGKNSYDIYDFVTYDKIRTYLQDNKDCKVVIINKSPDSVPYIFTSNFSLKNTYCYEVNWGAFTYTFYHSWRLKPKGASPWHFSRDELMLFHKLYESHSYHLEDEVYYNKIIRDARSIAEYHSRIKSENMRF